MFLWQTGNSLKEQGVNVERKKVSGTRRIPTLWRVQIPWYEYKGVYRMKSFKFLIFIFVLVIYNLCYLSCVYTKYGFLPFFIAMDMNSEDVWPFKDKSNLESEGFIYNISENNRSECIITGYNGKGKDLIIPEKIKGKKVVSIYGFSGKGLTSVVIPNGIKNIHGFDNNNLTSLIIPDSVTIIGDHSGNGAYIRGAFENNNLTSIYFPKNITKIGSFAFEGNNLININIPDSVTEIGMAAFANNKLTTIIIGENVKKIDLLAFDGNPLTNINIKGFIQNITAGAFGPEFTGIFYLNLNNPGNYIKQNNDWFFNGKVLTKPAKITTGSNVHMVRIDGKNPNTYYKDYIPQYFFGSSGTKSIQEARTTVLSIKSRYPSANLPTNISEFYKGTFYLLPGTHTIEAIYYAENYEGNQKSITWTNSMIWEQRYLFENYSYEITANLFEDGKQIQFGITRK